MTSFNSPKVAIIGAGLAGLTSGYRLKKLYPSINLSIFEARKRPGGRVLTVQINGEYEEAGATNLLDGNGQNLLNLAKELGHKIVYWSEPDKMGLYHADAIKDLHKEFAQPLPKISKNLLSHLRNKKSSFNNMQEVIDFVAGSNHIFKNYMEVWIRSWEGIEPEKVSLHAMEFFLRILVKEARLMQCVIDNHQRPNIERAMIKGGNGKLIQTLAESLKEHIHYDHPLIGTEQKDKSYLLTFKNGYQEEFDYLIFTNPASTLGDINISEDVIPCERLNIITSLVYGTVSKVLVPLSDSFSKDFPFIFFWDFITWHSLQKKVLTLYYAGKFGDFRSDGGNHFDFMKASMALNKASTFFPEDMKIFMSSDTPVNLTSMEQFKNLDFETSIFCWSSDPYSKGSYSSIGADQYKDFTKIMTYLGEQVKAPFRPIKDKIFFAGEHTAIKDIGTMEGAVESGERAARMVLVNLN